MRRFIALALTAAIVLPACHAASKPFQQSTVANAVESEPAPEQTAQAQSMMEQLKKLLAEQQASIRAHPPGGATIIPPLTVDPLFTIPDEQLIKQLERQLRIQLNNPQKVPEDDRS